MAEYEKNWNGKKRRAPDLEVLDNGEARPMPYSEEAEQHVLACCLLDGSDTIARALALKITPAAFHLPANSLLFERIVELYRTKPPVTLEILAEELNTRRELDAVGGLAYLMQVTEKIPTSAHATYFMAKLKETWVRRELIREATAAIEECHAFTGAEENALENLIAPLAMKFNRAADYARQGEETMKEKAARGYARTLLKLEGKHDKSRQLLTGLKLFDEKFGAFDVNEEDFLIGIGALTSGGKSAFTRKITDAFLQQGKDGKKGMVFLLETTIGKYLDLAACTATRINGRFLDSLPASDIPRFKAARERREKWVGERLWLFDESLKVEVLVARIEDHVRQHGMIDFAVIDHLHELYSAKNFKGNRESELGYIVKFLKQAAKRLNIPFFVPVQLNRSSTKDGVNRRPTKHDLRGSGEIENAFDRLLLLHMPKVDMRGAEQTDNQARVMVEVIQDKSRNGPIGHREFWFDRPFTDYIEIGDHEFTKAPGAPGGVKNAGGYGR